LGRGEFTEGATCLTPIFRDGSARGKRFGIGLHVFRLDFGDDKF